MATCSRAEYPVDVIQLLADAFVEREQTAEPKKRIKIRKRRPLRLLKQTSPDSSKSLAGIYARFS